MFEYEIVDTEYGDKLAISFDYDKQMVGQIKSLPWDVTHRSWDPDIGAWLIDYTDESISCFERRVNAIVPPDIKPDQGYQGDIEIVVPEGYTWFFLQSPPNEVNNLLYQELSYEAPNAEYTTSYKQGTWDGIIRLYDKQKQGAAVGLMDRAVEMIEELGYNVDISIRGDRDGTQADFSWEFEHPLRDYQREAVDALIANGSGVLSMPTGTGKTVTGLKATQELGRQTLIVVHTQELLYQWAEEIEEIFGHKPGMIGDGLWSEEPITVAIMQTLVSKGADTLKGDYGTLVFDECHRTSAADTMHEIGMDIDVEYRVGLSATPWRRVKGEELKIEGAIGNQVYQVTAEQMIDQGYLARPEFELIDPADYGSVDTAHDSMDYHKAYRQCISLSPTRNRAVAEKAAELASDGYKVLINVDRISHGRLLEYALNGDVSRGQLMDVVTSMDAKHRQQFISAVQTLDTVADVNAVFMHGSDSSETRQDILERFKSGEINVLVSTLLKEGVNIPSINAIVLAQAGKSDISQIQTIGRALRPKNGDHAKIADVKDQGKYFNDQFEIRQLAMKDYYGSYGPSVDDIPERTPDAKRSLTAEPPSFDDIFS